MIQHVFRECVKAAQKALIKRLGGDPVEEQIVDEIFVRIENRTEKDLRSILQHEKAFKMRGIALFICRHEGYPRMKLRAESCRESSD
jgi:hypothetical protein